MKQIDVQGELADEFEPSPLPPIGPDGGPELPKLKTATKPPPRLCEAGPCIHYHHLKIQMDAQRPLAESIEQGGKLVGDQPDQPFHVEDHHYCYPSVGIETNLGGLPVIQCNRWQPLTDRDHEVQAERKARFFESESGKRYQANLEAWRTEQTQAEAELVSELDPVSSWVLMFVIDDSQVEVVRIEDDGAEGLVSMSPSGARDNLDIGYLRSEFGPGTYRIEVHAVPIDSAGELISYKTFEVK